MIARHHILPISLFVLIAGCTTTKEPPGRHTFSFLHDGNRYEIVSIVIPTRPGGNFLLQFDDGRILLRAWDVDQDGVLDTLMVGDLTLDRANEIYGIGIAEARSRGRFATQPPSRVYELSTGGRSFAIWTSELNRDRPYNKFIIYTPLNQEEIVLIDANADGVLDSIERGKLRLDEGQAFYDHVLSTGLRDGKIERSGNRLLVKK